MVTVKTKQEGDSDCRVLGEKQRYPQSLNLILFQILSNMGPSLSILSFHGCQPHIHQQIQISHIKNLMGIAMCSALNTEDTWRTVSEERVLRWALFVPKLNFSVSYDVLFFFNHTSTRHKRCFFIYAVKIHRIVLFCWHCSRCTVYYKGMNWEF